MKIGIIIGSIREGRKAADVAHWVKEAASSLDGVDVELIDLAAFDVPLLTSATVPGAANKQYDSPAVTNFSRAIDACDGFVFVTPEYNHGVPGAFKNAFDSLGAEWWDKGVGFVAYGADGGVRAVEQWRQIVGNFNMHAVRAQVSLQLFTEFTDSGFTPNERRADEITTLLEQLVGATRRRLA